jgi:hypothetical protein
MVALLVLLSPYPKTPRPIASASGRHQPGGLGVARRVTPSGELYTRRRETSAAGPTAAGTPASIAA